MAVRPSEYRAQLRKEVTLSSGYTFLIRKIRIRDIFKTAKLPISLTEQEVQVSTSEVDIQQTLEYIDDIIIAGVVEPKVVKKAIDECSEDELSIYELSEQDSTELFQEIMKFSGAPLTQEEKQEYAPFPEERASTYNRPDGEKVPQTTQ